MIPHTQPAPANTGRVPRACGDDPDADTGAARYNVSSPRLRG